MNYNFLAFNRIVVVFYFFMTNILNKWHYFSDLKCRFIWNTKQQLLETPQQATHFAGSIEWKVWQYKAQVYRCLELDYKYFSGGFNTQMSCNVVGLVVRIRKHHRYTYYAKICIMTHRSKYVYYFSHYEFKVNNPTKHFNYHIRHCNYFFFCI